MKITSVKPGACTGHFLADPALLRNAITDIRSEGVELTAAVAVTGSADVHAWAGSVSRVYAGWEFCPNLFPEDAVLDAIAGTAAARGLALTLATPFLPPAAFARIAEATERLAGIWRGLTGEPLEVVVNDLGLLDRLRGNGQTVCAAGRLLVKQRRDPRAACDADGLPPVFRDHLRGGSHVFTPFAQVLRRLGVARFELDNVLAGVAPADNGMKLSLHFPLGLIASGRRCPWAERQRGSAVDYPAPCARDCAGQATRLRTDGLEAEVWASGTALFFVNRQIVETARAVKPDRLVFTPGLP